MKLKIFALVIFCFGLLLLLGKSVNAQATGNSALDPLRGEFDKIKADNRYIGATIYNVFATNNNDGSLTDAQLQYLCRGACGKIGANAANYYPQGSGFYSHAKSLGMLFTLAIARNKLDDVTGDLSSANSNGETPVIRLGVHDDSGGFTSDPQVYVTFLQNLN